MGKPIKPYKPRHVETPEEDKATLKMTARIFSDTFMNHYMADGETRYKDATEAQIDKFCASIKASWLAEQGE